MVGHLINNLLFTQKEEKHTKKKHTTKKWRGKMLPLELVNVSGWNTDYCNTVKTRWAIHKQQYNNLLNTYLPNKLSKCLCA